MVHRKNLDEFEPLARLVEEIGAIEWGVDLPCLAGSLQEHSDLLVPYEEAVPFLSFSFGGGYHGSSEGYACGRHLLTVLPNGQAVKCGFYEDQPLGDARQGLIECWLKLATCPPGKTWNAGGVPPSRNAPEGAVTGPRIPMAGTPLCAPCTGRRRENCRRDITDWVNSNSESTE